MAPYSLTQWEYLHYELLVLYVCRPLNDKHKKRSSALSVTLRLNVCSYFMSKYKLPYQYIQRNDDQSPFSSIE